LPKGHGKYDLPHFQGDYVLLTPKDILTKDDTWISRPDLLDRFEGIPDAIPNEQLRAQVSNYFFKLLPGDVVKKKDKREAAARTILQYPEVIDYYIKLQEDNGDEAQSISSFKVEATKQLFVEQVRALVQDLANHTGFYAVPGNTYDEAMARALFLKDIIENKDGYRLFYAKGGAPIEREEDLQIMYRLTWWATPSDINREVNNGRGPVDFKASRGRLDKTLIEFKLASNTHLRRNLEKQVAIYEKANDTKKSIKVIMYFTERDQIRVNRILEELNLKDDKSIILIDARNDNKPSASHA